MVFRCFCVLIASATLAACGDDREGAAIDAASLQCVPIPEGEYYFDGLHFRPTAAPTGSGAARPESVSGILGDVGRPWLSARQIGDVVILLGSAPDRETKARAIGQASARILAQGDGETLVIDAIASDGAPPPGAGVAPLGLEPSLQECRAAFDAIEMDHDIRFTTGRVQVDEASQPVADAVAAAAILCSDYAIEVGAHTDSRGAPASNRLISDDRAVAVRRYMLTRGVDPSVVTAVGYGDTQLLDERNTLEAHRRNSRIEFIVTER